MDAEFVEREYNNRALVRDYQAYFDRWEKDSEFVRETLPGELDLAYGPDPLQRMDVFAAPKSRGTLVFIHGGYWRSLDKRMFSWLAAAYVAAGVSIALPNYRLCPNVGIDDIVEDSIAAMNWLFANGAKHGISTARVVVSGHSAGGHLAAALLATPRARFQFDASRIVGAVPVSGIFDFEPLLQFSYNTDLRLDRESARRLTLLDKSPAIDAAMVIAAGADESSEFRRQSLDLAKAWVPLVKDVQILPGFNHFSIVDAFSERGQRLHDATLDLFA